MKSKDYTIKLLGYFFALSTALTIGISAGLSGSAEAASKGGSTGTHAVGLKVGQIWPTGNIGQGVDPAVKPGIFYEYGASDVFSIHAGILPTSFSEGALSVFVTHASMKAHLFYFDRLAPYVMVGAGVYGVSQKVGAAQETAKKTVFGIHLGFGADLDLNDKIFMGLGLDIHNLFTGTVTLPSNGRTEISGRLAAFLVHGGYRF